MLVHYTSLESVAKVLESRELWLSSPVFMNDYRECREFLDRALGQSNAGLFRELADVWCRGSTEQCEFEETLKELHQHFVQFEMLNDIFILCLSEHPIVNHHGPDDGRLSMWSRYADSGRGVAVVIDPGKLREVLPTEFSLEKVEYLPHSTVLDLVSAPLRAACEEIKKRSPGYSTPRESAQSIFETVSTLAITRKHPGFREEEEWRLIYRRRAESNPKFDNLIRPIVINGQIQPKLAIPLEKWIGSVADEDTTSSQLIHKVILGPCADPNYSLQAAAVLARHHGLARLANRITVSTIPLRGQ